MKLALFIGGVIYLKEFIKVELENKQIVKALVYFKNEETNPNAIDLSNPIVEWVDDFLD